MKTKTRIARFLIPFAVLLLSFALFSHCDSAVPDHRLLGQWHGQNRFGGMNRDEIVGHKVAVQNVDTQFTISSDGTVEGHIGGARLSQCAVRRNRGWLGRFLHIESDFVIRGNLIGAVVPGSDNSTHLISAPFNIKNDQISGTVFVLHNLTYPYPLLRLQLGH